MKANKRNALYLAGIILLASALVSQFKEAKLIWSTLMVVGTVIALVWGLKEDQKLYRCFKNTSKNKGKILGVGLGVSLVLFGLGFCVGKLVYLWLH